MTTSSNPTPTTTESEDSSSELSRIWRAIGRLEGTVNALLEGQRELKEGQQELKEGQQEIKESKSESSRNCGTNSKPTCVKCTGVWTGCFSLSLQSAGRCWYRFTRAGLLAAKIHTSTGYSLGY